jgi:hypothetical protein
MLKKILYFSKCVFFGIVLNHKRYSILSLYRDEYGFYRDTHPLAVSDRSVR